MGFNCSCKVIYVRLGNKENYQYSVRGSRYDNYYTGLDLGWFIRRRRIMSRKARNHL